MPPADGKIAFDGLAQHYAQARPGYPAELVAATAAAVDGVGGDAARERVMVDVGAGTGISTRAIASALRRPTRVLGVEPGEDMRRQAQAGAAAGGSTPGAPDGDAPSGPAAGDAAGGGSRGAVSRIEYVAGAAERLPVEDGGAVGVQVAQAIHWFDRPRFYAEVKRVLARGGVLAIMQNNRAWERSALVDAYETLLERHSPGYVRAYRVFDVAAELAESGGFGPCERIVVPWERPMAPDQFVTMARSSSRFDAVVARYGAEQAERMVRALLPPEARALMVPFDAELFLARTV
ncbi:class I SAM-dependent methyltransferase [Conexibacter sp. CPCC 206217]|uniref:class I SAM-dependent methyltransferase n=1 Tax=Conexibacter sp. CPCC 206217 TaxID=3064574 RepID=UPI00271A305A|nr:methyltransferase domain-containing protein [Conexibacter sp. CPCC 206217]MDO8209074.1 methyltransferase domain-containing protein [Conexibacter sp. CPCC 206217]